MKTKFKQPLIALFLMKFFCCRKKELSPWDYLCKQYDLTRGMTESVKETRRLLSSAVLLNFDIELYLYEEP